MKQGIIFYLLFNIFLFQRTECQSLDNVKIVADHFYNEQDYSLAIKEYQRYLFFSSSLNPVVLFQMGECYQKLNQYEKATEYFDKAFFSFTADSLKLKAMFKKTQCMILNREYSLALAELLGISDTLTGNNYYKRELYSGIAYFGLEDFTNAGNSFVNAINPAYTTERDLVKAIFKNKKRFYKPRPNTASILSMCFPGLGQFYSGDIRNGANSVLLTSALVYLGVRIAVNQTVWDAIFTIAPWYQRYYQGGYMRAEKIATEKRADKRRKAYEEVIQVIASTKS